MNDNQIVSAQRRNRMSRVDSMRINQPLRTVYMTYSTDDTASFIVSSARRLMCSANIEFALCDIIPSP